MSSLLLNQPDGSCIERPVKPDLVLGSAPGSPFPLPGLPDRLALITRSSVYRRWLLLDLTGGAAPPAVNGRRIAGLKVLHHLDEICLGQHRLIYWELLVREVPDDPEFLRKRCCVCKAHFQIGEQAILCPNCEAEHHKDHWFQLHYCSREGCVYPVLDSLVRSLSRWVHFEKLDENSEPVIARKTCSARTARDRGPFKSGDTLVNCPGCEEPFHAECWMRLQHCPSCNHDVAALIGTALTPGQTPPGGPS